ncbi:PHP domain-containing protein [soil metagenome]
MPARQPFTTLCQAAARKPKVSRADMHIHTVHSDGRYTPAEVVDLARRSGLAAVAITDHDTLGGVLAAQTAARGLDLEVISGVEISSRYRDREIHLLGYFVDLNNTELAEALSKMRLGRVERFELMRSRLREAGVSVPDTPTDDLRDKSLGRRSLAELLVESGRVGSIREAFNRFLGDGSAFTTPKPLLEAEQALRLIRLAGGVASWAHPAYDFTMSALPELRSWGLSAIEAVYPGYKKSKTLELRTWATANGLVITGGSDCHGPDSPLRAVGAVTISQEELELVRARLPS